MQIVTGYRGEPHITSNEIQGFNQGIFGSGNYVLNVGQKFNATLVNATTISIEDGEGVLQGVHFRIDPGDTDTVNISPGTTGYKRIDYICARYTKNVSTGVEDVSLVVVEGTPDATTPTAPTINAGDVLTGSSPVDFPLWEVDLDGLTPTLKKLSDLSVSISGSVPSAIVQTLGILMPTVYPKQNECYYYKTGSTVVVHFAASGMSNGTAYLVARLPVGYRPYKETYFWGYWSDNHAEISIGTNGYISITPRGSGSSASDVYFEARFDVIG